MARFWRILVASAVVWLVFISGFLCRNVLGDWLVEAHSGSVGTQFAVVAGGVSRVFLTFFIVAVAGLLCTGVLLVGSGLVQELWYQLFTRKIIAILMRQRERRQKEIRDALDEELDAADIGAPTKPVSALKHARSERQIESDLSGIQIGDVTVTESPEDEEPEEIPKTDRFKALRAQAEKAVEKESSFEKELKDQPKPPEFEITYDD